MRFALTLCLACVLSLPALAQETRRPTDLLQTALDLVPRDAVFAIVVPSLKRVNDDIVQMLEGMDRANLLVGSRPLDHFRAMSGLHAGVDELRGGVMVMFVGKFDVSYAFAVPVTNADEFLKSNFTRDEGNGERLVMASGEAVYARPLERHVILARNKDDLGSFDGQPWLAQRLHERFGERVEKVMLGGEAIVYLSEYFVSQLSGVVPTMADEAAPRGFPAMPALPLEGLTRGVDMALAVVNLDPLALGVTMMVAFNEESPFGSLRKAGAGDRGAAARSAPALSRLPRKPFYFAASASLDGSGLLEALRTQSGGLIDLPAWVGSAKGMQFAASPSALGVQGGLLNEATLVLLTDEPRTARDFMRDQLVVNGAQWEPAKREVEGVAVDGYVVPTPTGEGDAMMATAATVMFGRGGFRGFVGEAPGSLIITFSQRPDVFASAVKAAGGSDSLASDPVLRQMRAWLPPEADAEAFLGIGQFARIINQFKDMIPVGDIPIPTIDPKVKPVGFGLAAGDAMVEAGMVVPSDVLTILLDQVVERMKSIGATGKGLGN